MRELRVCTEHQCGRNCLYRNLWQMSSIPNCKLQNSTKRTEPESCDVDILRSRNVDVILNADWQVSDWSMQLSSAGSAIQPGQTPARAESRSGDDTENLFGNSCHIEKVQCDEHGFIEIHDGPPNPGDCREQVRRCLRHWRHYVVASEIWLDNDEHGMIRNMMTVVRNGILA